MKRQLEFIEPIAYTTDGIIMRQTREGAWTHPSKYTILSNDDKRTYDLTDEHCRQVDVYLAKTALPNPFIQHEEIPDVVTIEDVVTFSEQVERRIRELREVRDRDTR
jgi:hypothetical protein